MPTRSLKGVQLFPEVSESFLDNVLTAGVFDQDIGMFPRLLLTASVCDQHIERSTRETRVFALCTFAEGLIIAKRLTRPKASS